MRKTNFLVGHEVPACLGKDNLNLLDFEYSCYFGFHMLDKDCPEN